MKGFASVAARAAPSERRISEWDVPWGRHAVAGTAAINEITAFNLSSVWACQTLITDSIATLPVDVFRRTGDGREQVTPPIWVEQPNQDMSRIDYDTIRMLSLLSYGNAYSVLVRAGGVADPRAPVVQRIPIDPWNVRPVRAATGEIRYDIGGRSYAASQVQHIRGYIRPGDPLLQGMSVIEHARRSLGLGASAEAFGEGFYRNGLSSQVALEMPQMPSEVQDDVLAKLRETIADRYAGSGNAFRPLVLMGGTKASTLSVNPSDAQLLETRRFQVSEVARWFRVPPHMIGDVEKSTSWGTGINQQTLGFAKFTMQSWLARLEAADSALLAEPEFLRYNIDAFVRSDLLTRYQSYALGWGRWLSTNDIRRLEDAPPVDGGDVFLAPLNMADVTLFDGKLPTNPGPTSGDPNAQVQ